MVARQLAAFKQTTATMYALIRHLLPTTPGGKPAYVQHKPQIPTHTHTHTERERERILPRMVRVPNTTAELTPTRMASVLKRNSNCC